MGTSLELLRHIPAVCCGQQRGGRPDRPGGQAAPEQRRTDDQSGLQRPAGSQIEQVDEVGGTGDHPGPEQHVDDAAATRQQGRRREARRPDPHDLGQAAGDPALPQRAQVSPEALGLVLRPAADPVVVEPDGAGTQPGDRRSRGHRRGTRTERGGRGGGHRQRRPTGEVHRAAAEVGPVQPGRPTDAGQRGPGGHRTRGDQRRPGEPAHVTGFCFGSMALAPAATP